MLMRHDNPAMTLIDAAGRGDLEIVQHLLIEGADINMRDNDGWTALMSAARDNHLDVIQHLLTAGADIHVRDHDGETALMLAARWGHFEVVQQLLNAGADIHIRNQYGNTALMLSATYGGYPNIAEYLIRQGAQFEGLAIRVLPQTDASDFSNQIAQGNIHAAEALLNANRDLLNEPNRFDQTPLMRAVICGQLDAVDWLIDQHADVNAVSEDGFTAVYFAARALYVHRHADAETQAPYRAMLETMAGQNPSIDAHTQELIDHDETGVLDCINAATFILK